MSNPARIIETATTATTVDAEPAVMVRVTAPSSLEGGYTFDAVYNGEVFPVTVPDGGVKAGQTFAVPFLPAATIDAYAVAIDPPQLESPSLQHQQQQQQQQPSSEWTPMLPPQQQSPQHSIGQEQDQLQAPLGTWKTHWFDCLSEGLCHPSFCNAFWVPQILMGQVLTRMKLDCCGRRVGSSFQKSTCIWMVLTILMMYARSRLQECITTTDPANYSVWWDIIFDDDGDESPMDRVPIPHPIHGPAVHSKDDIGSNCTSDDADTLRTISWVWFWGTVLVVARLRRAVRKHHGISNRFPCEDVVCAAACQCCTVSQLARQTANYKEQRAYCCTNTGLAAGGGRFGGRQDELERRHVHGHHLVHAHGCEDHSHTHREPRNGGEQIV